MSPNVLLLDGDTRVRWWTLANLTGIQVVEQPDQSSTVLLGGAGDHPSVSVDLGAVDLRHRMELFLATAGIGWSLPQREESLSAAAVSTTSGLADEIERLAALHERGLLSTEEFVAAKARLINPAE
jgi:hypothetical protein